MTNEIIFITGPTASGKSSIAVEIAKILNTEIISCDSQQIYKEMNIGTNKITSIEMDGVVHHMLDIINPMDEYSVEDFSNEVTNIIQQINNKGKIPIVTGGTGFYLDSILFDMNYGATGKNNTIREKYKKIKNNMGSDYLHSILEKIDSVSAEKYHINETNRIIRALEIYEITGKKPSEIRKGKNKIKNNLDPLLFFINYNNRKLLYDKINNRVIKMFKEGLYGEFLFLLNKYKLDKNFQSMKAIGYKELFYLYENELNEDQTINLIQKNTRRYAKRQITWMKKYLNYDFTYYKDRENIDKSDLIKEIIGDIKEKYDI